MIACTTMRPIPGNANTCSIAQNEALRGPLLGVQSSNALLVTTLCCCGTHIAEPDITLDKLPRPQSGFAEAAAAGSSEPDDVPFFKHHVRDFGAQRLLLSVADQVQRTWRRGLSAGETEWTEPRNVTGMSLSIISIGMFALLCIPNDSADAPSTPSTQDPHMRPSSAR